MLKVINQVDFDRLYENAWGQAVEVLDEISKAGMEEELMDFLEDLYPDGADAMELNDLLAYDWEWVYEQIGMETEEASKTSEED